MTIEQAVPLRSTIPARLDRLGWSPFHTRMVAGLGAAWILDGLQITISSSVTGVLQSPQTFGALIGDGSSRSGLVLGYVIGGLIMAAGGVIELVFGIKAEGQSLETITKPLTAVSAEGAEEGASYG